MLLTEHYSTLKKRASHGTGNSQICYLNWGGGVKPGVLMYITWVSHPGQMNRVFSTSQNCCHNYPDTTPGSKRRKQQSMK
jgi:hypothetical protein